jgi:hypothetical protein
LAEDINALVEGREIMRQVVAGVELVSPYALGALDTAIELRGFGRQHEERDALVFAGLLELGHEFGTAIDLDGFQRDGECGAPIVEGRSPAVAAEGFGGRETGDRIVGGELVDGLVG